MIRNLLSNIRTEILKQPDIRSCEVYPGPRTIIEAPAVFLEIDSYSSGEDPATGELALIANVEARIVVDSTIKNAELVCQTLACNVANLAHLNSFDCEVSPAMISGISRDEFHADLDAFVCWKITWTHQFHIGVSVWLESGPQPHIINIGEKIANG